jgi:hypothetical protein
LFSLGRGSLLSLLLILIGTAGCAGDVDGVDLEQVPIGATVDVTREDGGVVRGTLAARDDRNVRLTVGRDGREVPRGDISSVQLVDEVEPTVLPAAAMFREFTVPEGTVLEGRLESSLGSDTSSVDDAVEMTLTEAVAVQGTEVLPSGSTLRGVVTAADPAGNVKGRARLAVRFRTVSVAGQDEAYPLSAGLSITSASTKQDDAKKIGIPAAGGAIVGAIIGGKKGAGIGAAIGGGVGSAVVLTSSGPEVRLPGGTPLSLTLDQAMTDVRVPIKR